MKWITREPPKIDCIACPCLIKNFVDKNAEFIYVPKEDVFKNPKELNTIPYDIPGAEYSHYGDECTFDFIIKNAISRFELVQQTAGLWAISAGLSYNYKNDYEQLKTGMKIYDALYSWAKHV